MRYCPTRRRQAVDSPLRRLISPAKGSSCIARSAALTRGCSFWGSFRKSFCAGPVSCRFQLIQKLSQGKGFTPTKSQPATAKRCDFGLGRPYRGIAALKIGSQRLTNQFGASAGFCLPDFLKPLQQGWRQRNCHGLRSSHKCYSVILVDNYNMLASQNLGLRAEKARVAPRLAWTGRNSSYSWSVEPPGWVPLSTPSSCGEGILAVSGFNRPL